MARKPKRAEAGTSKKSFAEGIHERLQAAELGAMQGAPDPVAAVIEAVESAVDPDLATDTETTESARKRPVHRPSERNLAE